MLTSLARQVKARKTRSKQTGLWGNRVDISAVHAFMQTNTYDYIHVWMVFPCLPYRVIGAALVVIVEAQGV